MNVQSILGVKGPTVVTMPGTASIAAAAATMRDSKIGAVVVSADGVHVDGILSERDVVRCLADHGATALGRSIDTVMTTEVVTCGVGDSVESLMHSMTERRIRHLPVVEGKALGGIISIGDVVKGRLAELQDENQHLVDYISGR